MQSHHQQKSRKPWLSSIRLRKRRCNRVIGRSLLASSHNLRLAHTYGHTGYVENFVRTAASAN